MKLHCSGTVFSSMICSAATRGGPTISNLKIHQDGKE
jgi:hypothetical protein